MDDMNDESAKVDRKCARVKKLKNFFKKIVARRSRSFFLSFCSLSRRAASCLHMGAPHLQLATAGAAPAFFPEQRATGRPAE